jgi:pyrophosphatase PpaX
LRKAHGNNTLIDVKAILFDLDGTLVDSEEMILSSFRYVTQTCLGAAPPDEVLREMIGIPLPYQMEKISPEHAEEMTLLYREHNRTVHDKLIKGFPGTAEALQILAQAGYRLAVVTSKLGERALHGLEIFGLSGFFEFVQGSDKTTLHKPNPEPLLVAAGALRLEPVECAYVGDSPYDMQAARAADMCAIAALWGIFSQEKLHEAGAQHEVRTISELPALFNA